MRKLKLWEIHKKGYNPTIPSQHGYVSGLVAAVALLGLGLNMRFSIVTTQYNYTGSTGLRGTANTDWLREQVGSTVH